MALKQDGIHFVLCPKQGNKIEGVVLNRVRIIEIFSSKQGQGFITSAAQLYPNIGRVIPPPLREGGPRLISLATMFRVRENYNSVGLLRLSLRIRPSYGARGEEILALLLFRFIFSPFPQKRLILRLFTTVFAFVFVAVTALLNHLALWALRYFASTRLFVACRI